MADKSSEQHRRADEEVRKKLPPGVKLVRTLRGHTSWIGRIAWSPDGRMIASPSNDKTIRLWDTETGECSRTLEGHENSVISVAFERDNTTFASGSADKTIRLWESASGKLIRPLNGHSDNVRCVAFDSAGHTLASVSDDKTVRLWEPASGKLLHTQKGHHWVLTAAFDTAGYALASADLDGKIMLWEPVGGTLLHTLPAHEQGVSSVAFSPAGAMLASASYDKTIKLWEPASGKLLRTLEGHTQGVMSIDFLFDGRLIASKDQGGTIRFWNPQTGEPFGTLEEVSGGFWPPSIAFHPNLPLLASVGSDPGAPINDRDCIIHIWELDLAVLLGQAAEPSAHYVNAKMVLVGDTGVGKSALSLVLTNQPYKETDSTAGRHVWTFDSREVPVGPNVTQTRETLLWDLAGQPGYRVIHQLHLNEVAVALVVFDARSETDPLAGVRHWERALRLAQQRQGNTCVPMKKFLVSARNDRGGVSVSKERLNALIEEFHFDGYFETSAKEGWDIQKLRAAMEQAIAWEQLPGFRPHSCSPTSNRSCWR